MNNIRTMIKDLVKDILQAELKEITPDIVATILLQIKLSTDKLLRIVKDVPVQTKATIMDETSVITATTQGATTKSLSESNDMLLYQSEQDIDSDNNLLTQDDEEIQRYEKPAAKLSNSKNPISQETQS
eukprot:2921777-Ditylum_brightwellii.AAC.1